MGCGSSKPLPNNLRHKTTRASPQTQTKPTRPPNILRYSAIYYPPTQQTSENTQAPIITLTLPSGGETTLHTPGVALSSTLSAAQPKEAQTQASPAIPERKSSIVTSNSAQTANLIKQNDTKIPKPAKGSNNPRSYKKLKIPAADEGIDKGNLKHPFHTSAKQEEEVFSADMFQLRRAQTGEYLKQERRRSMPVRSVTYTYQITTSDTTIPSFNRVTQEA